MENPGQFCVEINTSALILLNDPKTGNPLGIIEGNLISSMRTFAVSVVALRRFIRPNSVIGIIGLGKLGAMHLRHLPKLFPEIRKIYVHSARGALPEMTKNGDCHIKAASLSETIAESDALITLTAKEAPYIFNAHLQDRPYLIINQSLVDFDPDVFVGSSAIVLDDIEQNIAAKKIFGSAFERGQIPVQKLFELSSVVYGNKLVETGRVMVNPIGMAVYDVYIAKKIMARLADMAPRF